ncbi:type IV pilin N-terminal domain-containing protein [Methanoculleus sp.]|uniref:type IV pilin N-terminal domain-containing protein n=1 Tax=Methanoculleus sp. TaxID=90427 RepID=UPI001BD24A89|nr:type IV pilin N-terminal domain-containing protein [Methanoculleus sp.]
MIRKSDEAVSPVIGVMLMLVVTIIIAAVVSAFAGGLAGDQQKTPQVSLKAEPVIQAFAEGKTLTEDYEDGFTAANGIEFENVGGDTFRLTDINVVLDCGGTKYTITFDDKIPSDHTCLPAGITAGNEFEYDENWVSVPVNWSYFAKIGGTSLEDVTIAPGDKFMLYADGQYDSTHDTQYGVSSSNGKYLTWTPLGTAHGIGAQFGTKVGYTIIDRDTSKVISSGYVVFR